MLPGKKYSPEDFLRIAWTRKWFIVIPTIVVAAGTFGYSSQLANRYSSSTTILVVPQRVPETYVRSTVTADVAERLQTISQQILSRTRLERIIEEFNLYPEDRKTRIMEDIVAEMRTRDIKLNIATPRNRGEDASHFSLSFEYSHPRTAMQVVERLASMFVQENMEDRAVLADSTNQFLQAQVEDARRRLIEHETKLEAFRQRNSGQLPTQVASNLQMMQVTQSQIQANGDAFNRERDRLAVLEGSIGEMIAALSQAPTEAIDPDGTPRGSVEQQLEAARGALKSLERRLKPTHPDIGRQKRFIADLEAKVAEVSSKNTEIALAEGSKTSVSAPPQVASKIEGLRLEANQLRRSLETRRAEDERLKRVLASYSVRLEAAPKLESELTELMRDYSTLQEQYQTLLKKSEESKIAVNLERRQIGEQFKIIDGARLPERPIWPDRLRMNAMGLLAGLGLGIALAALLEYRDTTLKTDDDVVISLALPVLAVIPAMVTASDRRRLRRRRWVYGTAASLAVVVVAAAAILWRMQVIQNWMR